MIVDEALVELRGVSKSFGATRALHDVSFAVRAGEVHVLAGENGAGKSTLIRILSGVIADYQGEMRIAGERVRLRDARDAARRGIATIHQELSLVGSMSVAENLALPRPGSLLGWTRRAEEAREAREMLAAMDLDVAPEALVESLPLSAQQLIEIARALARKARVLILDEPTSALSEPEAERLLERVEKLAAGGCGVVYISHRMEESDRLAHRITVLCDGQVAASRAAKDLPRAELVRLMMGQRDGAIAESSGVSAGTPQKLTMQPGAEVPVLAVRDLHLEAPGVAPLHGVSFAAAAGEIVGLAGLRGSGASEALAALFGAFGRRARGEVRIDGTPLAIESPARSIAAGLMFLASDRRKAVLYDLSVSENISLSRLAELARWGVLPLGEEARLAKEMIGRLRVATPSLDTAARALSGGNQQKVALLRGVAAGPRALLCDEPTRGVDVSAKADIHRSLRALAGAGKAIVVVGSELLELLELCDRIVVLWRGRVTKTLEKKDFSREGLRLALDLERAPPGEQTARGAAE